MFPMTITRVSHSVCLCESHTLILCDPMDCSLPGSSVHGILQARVLEGVAIPFSRRSSFLTQGSNLDLPHCRQILYHLSHQGSPDNNKMHYKSLIMQSGKTRDVQTIICCHLNIYKHCGPGRQEN